MTSAYFCTALSFPYHSTEQKMYLLVEIKIRWLIQSDFVCINQEEAWDFCGDKHSFNDLSFTQLLIICVVISCLSFAFNYTLPTQLNIKEYLHTRRNKKTTSTTHAIVWLILLLLCPCFSVFEIFWYVWKMDSDIYVIRKRLWTSWRLLTSQRSLLASPPFYQNEILRKILSFK